MKTKTKEKLKREMKQCAKSNGGSIGDWLVHLYTRDDEEIRNLMRKYDCSFTELCEIYGEIKWNVSKPSKQRRTVNLTKAGYDRIKKFCDSRNLKIAAWLETTALNQMIEQETNNL